MTTPLVPDALAEAARRAMTDWRDAVVPLLMEFGRIPDLSPAYDPGWEAHGELERAAELLAGLGPDPRPARGDGRGRPHRRA